MKDLGVHSFKIGKRTNSNFLILRVYVFLWPSWIACSLYCQGYTKGRKTNVHGNNITPNFMFTIISHFKRNKISSSYLFTFLKPFFLLRLYMGSIFNLILSTISCETMFSKTFPSMLMEYTLTLDLHVHLKVFGGSLNNHLLQFNLPTLHNPIIIKYIKYSLNDIINKLFAIIFTYTSTLFFGN